MFVYRPVRTERGPDGVPKRTKAALYWGRFRDPSTGRTRQVALKTPDRVLAKQLLAKIVREASLEAAGLTNPFEQHAKRPLAEHLAEWRADMTARGVSANQVRLVTGRAERLLQACNVRHFGDLAPSAVSGYLGDLRKANKSAQTRNFYLQAVKQFARWMVQDRRAPSNPIEFLKAENVRKDRRHDRRALEVDELRSLLRVTREGPTRRGLSGGERATLYEVAATTGLRAAELASLRWSDLQLDGRTPTVTVRAAYAKNGREDTLPLSPATAAVLAALRAQRKPTADGPVMAVPPSHYTAKLLRGDLKRARAAWIKAATTDAERAARERTSFLAYRDTSGTFADFHSLRHTFITNLARAGVAPKVAQDLARHSDINLTLSRYSHTVLADQAKAVTALPDLTSPTADDQSAA